MLLEDRDAVVGEDSPEDVGQFRLGVGSQATHDRDPRAEVGEELGHLHADVEGDRASIDFDYKNNGRGPTMKEQVRLDGWLAPPSAMRVQVRMQEGAQEVVADAAGRFVLEGLPEEQGAAVEEAAVEVFVEGAPGGRGFGGHASTVRPPEAPSPQMLPRAALP